MVLLYSFISKNFTNLLGTYTERHTYASIELDKAVKHFMCFLEPGSWVPDILELQLSEVFNRPGEAGALLQTAPSLIK